MGRRLLLLASSPLLLVAACGGGSGPVAEPTSPPEATTSAPRPDASEAEPTPEETTTKAEPPPPGAPPGAPSNVAGYRNWVRLNDEPIPHRDADPHLGTKNVYASEDRRPNGQFPYGTIVVKDASRPGKDFIGLIAIMRKERGADPAHRDWVFAEFTRDARNERFEQIASGAVCWSNHMGAVDSDYVFTDRRRPPSVVDPLDRDDVLRREVHGSGRPPADDVSARKHSHGLDDAAVAEEQPSLMRSPSVLGPRGDLGRKPVGQPGGLLQAAEPA